MLKGINDHQNGIEIQKIIMRDCFLNILRGVICFDYFNMYMGYVSYCNNNLRENEINNEYVVKYVCSEGHFSF